MLTLQPVPLLLYCCSTSFYPLCFTASTLCSVLHKPSLSRQDDRAPSRRCWGISKRAFCSTAFTPTANSSVLSYHPRLQILQHIARPLAVLSNYLFPVSLPCCAFLHHSSFILCYLEPFVIHRHLIVSRASDGRTGPLALDGLLYSPAVHTTSAWSTLPMLQNYTANSLNSTRFGEKPLMFSFCFYRCV